VRVPSSHQQSDKASDDQWFEPEPATTAMLAYAELRNEMRANATKKPEKGEGHEINCCETLRRPSVVLARDKTRASSLLAIEKSQRQQSCKTSIARLR
jgi:hypothetical protein